MPDRKGRRDTASTKSQRYIDVPNHCIIHLGGPIPGAGGREIGFPGETTGYLLIGGWWVSGAP